MRYSWIAGVLLACLLWPGIGWSAIYHCQKDGQDVFSDRPCGEAAIRMTVNPTTIGGRLDTGTDIEFWEPPDEPEESGSMTGCPAGYIQSTQLRRLRARNRVSEGMSPEQVRYILGAPDHRSGQWWVYVSRGEETGRYRFEEGCLDRWR